MTDRARVAVIVPVYRGAEHVRECLASLRDIDAHVIAVDDFSDDGTAEMIAAEFPKTHLVRRDENGGFARAVNTGVEHVPDHCEYIALLNSDAVAQPNWLDAAVDALDARSELGSVASRTMLYDKPDIVESAGLAYTVSGWAYRRGFNEQFVEPWTTPHELLGPTGAAAISRRSALKQLDCFFREDLTCYYEDVDLAIRLQLAGFPSLYVPDSMVLHKVSQSYAKLPAAKAYYVARNLEWLFTEYMPPSLLRRARRQHRWLNIMHAVSALKNGYYRAHRRGKRDATHDRPMLLERRTAHDPAALERLADLVERDTFAQIRRYRAR